MDPYSSRSISAPADPGLGDTKVAGELITCGQVIGLQHRVILGVGASQFEPAYTRAPHGPHMHLDESRGSSQLPSTPQLSLERSQVSCAWDSISKIN